MPSSRLTGADNMLSVCIKCDKKSTIILQNQSYNLFLHVYQNESRLVLSV